MANLQPTYRALHRKGLPGAIANSELSNRISRTVESAAGIQFGQPAFRGSNDHGVIAGATFAGTAVATAATGNTGNGTMGAVTVSAGAMPGNYTLTVLEPTTNAGEFIVYDPDGVFVGKGDVASAFSAGGLAFTLADGSTDFNGGDSFNIAVTYTVDAAFVGLAILDAGVITNSTTPDAYQQYQTGAFLTLGPMYVTAGGTVNDGDQVYWNPATGRYTATTTHVRLANCRFDTTGVDGDIVEVMVRLRNA